MIRLATRTSPLAMVQARFVQDSLASRGIDSEIVEVATKGDHDLTTPLHQLGGQGIFSVEIQRAVLDGAADVAVHSAKDLPSASMPGLTLASVPERRDRADALVGSTLDGLSVGATIATGSPRRRALLLSRRPDLNVVELRGNMTKRLSHAGRDGVSAVVAAVAALERLGLDDQITERLDPSWCTPQVGQGALALEVRTDDVESSSAIAKLSSPSDELAVRAERAFLAELGVGCSVPAGASADVIDGVITLRAVMLSTDGSTCLRAESSSTDPIALGASLAKELRDVQGGAMLVGWRES